jgi:hypothetical protein
MRCGPKLLLVVVVFFVYDFPNKVVCNFIYNQYFLTCSCNGSDEELKFLALCIQIVHRIAGYSYAESDT